MTKVVVVGSVNVDVVVPVAHLPAPGETVLGADVAYHPGGKGANQAVAATRQGVRTMLVAATGADEFGARVRATLAAERLDLSLLRTLVDMPTGVALITVSADGENMITVAGGANAALAVGADELQAVLHPGDVVLLQLEIPLATARAAAEAARGCGTRVMLNAAPLPAGLGPELSPLLRAVDVLVVNETEAVGLDGGDEPKEIDDWQALASRLCAHGPSACVVTLGGRGAVLAADGVTSYRPAFDVDVVDTTGAGDAFCGAMAAAVALGIALADAVAVGAAAGALATTGLGAQATLPTAAEVAPLLSGAGVRTDDQ